MSERQTQIDCYGVLPVSPRVGVISPGEVAAAQALARNARPILVSTSTDSGTTHTGTRCAYLVDGRCNLFAELLNRTGVTPARCLQLPTIQIARR